MQGSAAGASDAASNTAAAGETEELSAAGLLQQARAPPHLRVPGGAAVEGPPTDGSGSSFVVPSPAALPPAAGAALQQLSESPVGPTPTAFSEAPSTILHGLPARAWPAVDPARPDAHPGAATGTERPPSDSGRSGDRPAAQAHGDEGGGGVRPPPRVGDGEPAHDSGVTPRPAGPVAAASRKGAAGDGRLLTPAGPSSASASPASSASSARRPPPPPSRDGGQAVAATHGQEKPASPSHRGNDGARPSGRRVGELPDPGRLSQRHVQQQLPGQSVAPAAPRLRPPSPAARAAVLHADSDDAALRPLGPPGDAWLPHQQQRQPPASGPPHPLPLARPLHSGSFMVRAPPPPRGAPQAGGGSGGGDLYGLALQGGGGWLGPHLGASASGPRFVPPAMLQMAGSRPPGLPMHMQMHPYYHQQQPAPMYVMRMGPRGPVPVMMAPGGVGDAH